MKLVSIIIPVYNVEKYLGECLGTVIGQTYKNLEIILVDDGSTDNSGLICEEWAKKDNRIKVFHKQNGGLMNAWKYGVIRAQGEYIGFVDSDDWIDDNMFEILLNAASDKNAELVVCSFVHENYKRYKQETYLDNGVYSREYIEQRIYPVLVRKECYLRRGLSESRWTKLFKKDVLLNVLSYCDEKVSIGEDLLTTFAVMPYVNSLVVLGDFYPYHYRETNISMIRCFSREKYEKIENLKSAMLKAMELYNYNFNEQIHGDYIALMLQYVELEILDSNSKSSEKFLA